MAWVSDAARSPLISAQLMKSCATGLSGKLRAIAVTTETRSEALPDAPTVSEFVAGYEASNSWGIAAHITNHRYCPLLRVVDPQLEVPRKAIEPNEYRSWMR